MRLKLRVGHDVVHFDDGRSIIGSLTAGLAQRINDPKAQLLALNTILNGTLDVHGAATALSQQTGIASASAYQLIIALLENGHIEDLDERTILSHAEQERYSRNANYFAWITKEPETNRWAPQEALRQTRACVLGAGGVGSTIALQLAAVGVGELTIIDSDHVELSNLNRQWLFSTEDLGRPKAAVAEQRLRALNPHVELHHYVEAITSTQRILDLFEQHDILFRSADRPDDLPFWVSDAALITGKPWIECSYNGPVVNCCTFVPGQTGCYRCLRESEFSRLNSAGRGDAYSDRVPDFNAVLGPIATIVGSLAAYEGIRMITNKCPQTMGRAVHQNMYRYDKSYVIEVPNNCHHYGDAQRHQIE